MTALRVTAVPALSPQAAMEDLCAATPSQTTLTRLETPYDRFMKHYDRAHPYEDVIPPLLEALRPAPKEAPSPGKQPRQN